MHAILSIPGTNRQCVAGSDVPLPYDGAPHDLPDCGFSGGVLYYINKPMIGRRCHVFLYWLESIRCPFLDAVMQAFTCFGEELAFLLLALTIFWCVSKEEGYYLLFVGFFGTVLNQFLKLLCRIPRPWVRDPSFTIVESARSGRAAIPSRPATRRTPSARSAESLAGTKSRALRIVCIVLAALTAFSRMYLGVHTPLDVSVAAVTAVVLIFVIYPIVRSAAEDQKNGRSARRDDRRGAGLCDLCEFCPFPGGRRPGQPL